MPDPSPSTLTVINSNFLQLGRRSGGRPQPTVQGNLRLKVIDLGVNWKLIMRLPIIVILAVSAAVFEILTLKSRKWLIFPHHPCLTLPLGGTP